MAKVGDIRHWKAETLEKLFDTAAARAASLHRLGEGMEQVANDLSTWGGVTAGAWKDSAGKTRVDLGDKADAAEKVAKAVKPANRETESRPPASNSVKPLPGVSGGEP